MRTVAIVNLKGGVAKTSTAVNMAAILAADHNQRVLLVDADSQCNATEFFGGDPSKGNLAVALRSGFDGAGYAASVIRPSTFPGVDLLPGDDTLMDLDLTKVERNGATVGVLRNLARKLSLEGRYDTCIVDCPPAFNAASAAALLAADEVIIPVKLDAFSLRGMVNLMRQVANMQRINPKLRVSGCLITMWYRDQVIEQAEKTLRESNLPVFSTHIRRTDKVDGMTFAQAPLNMFSPRSSAGVDYRRFVTEWKEGANNG